VALLEMLDDPSASELSPHQTRERLRDLLKSGAVRPQLLARAATTEPARVRERLGELLRESGFDSPAASIRSADPRVRSRILSWLPSGAASRHVVSQ
jgi:flagellar basal body-associated protein FliL